MTFNHSRVQDSGLAVLQGVLASMKTLRSLNIAGNDATPEGARVVFGAVSPLTSLRKLDMSYQAALSGSGVGAFASGIRDLQSLHTLMLISVGLDATGVLFQALFASCRQQTSPTIRNLSL